jgi:hypothetical protein
VHEKEPQRPPYRAVDVEEFMRDGVYRKMAQRKRFGLQRSLAALRAVRAGERRVARHAPLRAGNRCVGVRGHHREGDSMTNNPDSTSLDARCYVIDARTSSFSSTLFSIGA